MTVIMKGSEVALKMKEKIIDEVEELKGKGIIPGLAIVRVGTRPDDIAYERNAVKKLEGIGIKCRVFEYPENISQQEFEKQFFKVNENPEVHGILLFRPLPKHLDEEEIKKIINPQKDMDCMSPVNIAKVFSGDDTGYAPCTPEAVMEVLDHYGIQLQGKNVVIVGRSMVVGKPLSMLFLKKNATITICHTKTKNIEEICRNADILIAAVGRTKMITKEFVSDNTILVDVGINVDAEGNLCGDMDYENISQIAGYITPVPGGVGTVTSSVLGKHVIKAAKRMLGN